MSTWLIVFVDFIPKMMTSLARRRRGTLWIRSVPVEIDGQAECYASEKTIPSSQLASNNEARDKQRIIIDMKSLLRMQLKMQRNTDCRRKLTKKIVPIVSIQRTF